MTSGERAIQCGPLHEVKLSVLKITVFVINSIIIHV